MSCKYCDLKRRKDEDDDAEWIAGEDWESESGDGGYICPHGDGFRMLVYYDARCACTAVDNIKYCPFCGEELKAPKEPLIKDEKIRKLVKAWIDNIRDVMCDGGERMSLSKRDAIEGAISDIDNAILCLLDAYDVGGRDELAKVKRGLEDELEHLREEEE